jgi:hypothetical protein
MDNVDYPSRSMDQEHPSTLFSAWANPNYEWLLLLHFHAFGFRDFISFYDNFCGQAKVKSVSD